MKSFKEQYYNSTKIRGTTFDIFVNPTRKELAELKSISKEGVRFFVDCKKKNIYMYSAEVLHDDMVDHISDLSWFNYTKYYMEGKQVDRVFSGHMAWGSKVESDTWNIGGDLWRHARTPENIADMKTLLFTDMTWLDKYISAKEVKSIIEKLIQSITGSSKKVTQ
jgi:hypothetical protein